MKIAEATLNLTSSHALTSEQQTSESLQAWVGDQPSRPAQAARESSGTPLPPDAVELSAQALASHAENLRDIVANKTDKAEELADEGTAPLDPRIEAIRRTLELLTGQKIRLTSFSPGQQPAPPPQGDGEPKRLGWGLAYDYHASYREEETTTVAATGRIATSDGRTIDFSLDLIMHRAYAESTDIAIRAGDATLVDPLVINFAGTAAQLSDASFAFDLDNDGNEEQISRLAAGSGFLALDRNNDGVVNNGSELFGPESGNGFADLARYDSDGNGWLDDNDPMFRSLKLWITDGVGKDSLTGLADHNIGALLLDPVESQFRLTDAANATLAQLRQTSLFIRENGSVGTVQEIDLAV